MRIFSKLYDTAMRWSAHRHAQYYLAGLSFAESSFFPVPPDVMLAPMALANRQRAWFYAGLTTLASVLGGVAGYVIGWLAFDLVAPMLERLGYMQQYAEVKQWFGEWGVWAIFIAGFSPIPYKIFTIAAGVVAMPLLPFVIASAIGRGGRFFLVAGLMVLGGEPMERMLRRYVDVLGWAVIALAAVAYVIWR